MSARLEIIRLSSGKRQSNSPRILQEHTVVALFGGDFVGLEGVDGIVQCNPVVEMECIIGKPCHAVGASLRASAVPDVGGEVMVIIAGGKEACAWIARHDLETEDVAIEGIRLRDVAYLQMDMSDRCAVRHPTHSGLRGAVVRSLS